MNSRLLFVLAFLFMAGIAIARADEYEEHEDETSNDEEQTMEDMKTETALVQNDDPDALKNKGSCHLGIGIWRKPGSDVRCNCMKCVCKPGGHWACGFEYSYCPYFYCGGQIYNPKIQICCCGKIYTKQTNYHCCGWYYYNGLTSKCCPFSSVKPKKAYCPRSKI